MAETICIRPSRNLKVRSSAAAAALLLTTAVPDAGGQPAAPVAPRPAVSAGAAGAPLVYTPDARGNRIPDFSHAGYRGGGRALPDVPVRLVVGPGGGRDGARIQAALEAVARLPVDANGFRGAVLLEPGTYEVDGSLTIAASGVVLRGAGPKDGGTTIVATGTSRRSVVVVAGQGTHREVEATKATIADDYVPVGATSVTLAGDVGFAVGDTVLVRRPSTIEWIELLGMNTFPGWRPENRLHWQPGSRDVVWDRVVTAVDGRRVTLDAPITTAIDRAYGGGSVVRYEFPGRISDVGVENLRLVSAYDPTRPMDEDHAWFGISLDKVENAWVRRVSARHFVSYVVNVETGSRAVTVDDVEALEPVSEIGGYRRRVFYTAGQLTLFRRCHSEFGRHDFAVGFAAAGPNVFLECRSREALGESGPLESWASGVLYDNVVVRGHALRLGDRGVAGQGSGWAAANSVLWNCEATDVDVHNPPGAFNRAYGCKGVASGDGFVHEARAVPYRDFYRGLAVEPRSLYLAQLAERLGPESLSALDAPGPSLDRAGARMLTADDLAAFERREAERRAQPSAGPLRRDGASFTIDGTRAWSARRSYSWFQAQMSPHLARPFGPAITRFAPGRTGVGLTDELEEMAASLAPGTAFYQHYGLWYDRRRVDHNYDGSADRRTGDVWAPFMELPWARSGQGRAWDGLSKYDLTRFNPWYFERLAAFAAIADRRALILYHHFYFQHWLLESRSHYVDFPWRPVNALQDTGLPDEVPAANAFYDIDHPMRRDLHHLYIRRALDALKDHTNVVHGIDREYTGSLAFVQFWLDTLAEWQREHGRALFIALEIPKDQMDAILDDPVRGPMVSAIDFHAWVYRPDGTLFAARGGLNRAPREQRPDIATPEELEALKTRLGQSALDQSDFLNSPDYQKLFDALWASSTPMKYRAWREYRDRYPDVVILRTDDAYPDLTRGVEQVVPRGVRQALRPTDAVRSPRETAWAAARPGAAYLVYAATSQAIELDLTGDTASYDVTWIDGMTGTSHAAVARVAGGRTVRLVPPVASPDRPWAAWLTPAPDASPLADGVPAAGVQPVVWHVDNLERIGGHPVTVVGRPRVVETPVGPAVEFNGESDGLFLDVNPIAGLSRFTIEVLFAPAADGPEEQRFLHFEESGTGNRALVETRHLPNGRWALDTFLRHGDEALTLLDRSLVHPPDTWHLAALTYDGTTMRHYVDGVLQGEGTVAFETLKAGRTSIGVRQNRVSWFKGRVAEVCITPRAVEPDELRRRAKR
jgi:hypothetical protein